MNIDHEPLPGYKQDRKGLYRNDEHGTWRPIDIVWGKIVIQKIGSNEPITRFNRRQFERGLRTPRHYNKR